MQKGKNFFSVLAIIVTITMGFIYFYGLKEKNSELEGIEGKYKDLKLSKRLINLSITHIFF